MDMDTYCCSKIGDEILIILILGLQIRVRNKRKKHTFFLISQPKYILGTQRTGPFEHPKHMVELLRSPDKSV